MANTQAPASAPGQSFRRMVEDVAMILAMVCLLRGFVAEAFVIPTGSMATTLHGANRKTACPQCQHVTAHNLPGGGAKSAGGWCMNCRYPLPATVASGLGFGEAGDRLVASKFDYERRDPQRWDTPIFKYPSEFDPRDPPTSSSRTNFIKRIVGLPGEEVLLDGGNAYVRGAPNEEYRIAAKHPAALLATRRLVWHNDHPARDLRELKFPPRWRADDPKAAEALDGSRAFSLKGDATVAYGHLLGGGEREAGAPYRLSEAAGKAPQLITDFEAYNHKRDPDAIPGHGRWFDLPANNWVGELTLEARIAARNNVGKVALELTQSVRVCRCELDFAARQVRLLLDGKELAAAGFPKSVGNAVAVRFANVDDHLTVWLDERLAFPQQVALPPLPADRRGPSRADLQPARIVAAGADALVSGLVLHRDIHYTTPIVGFANGRPLPGDHGHPDIDLRDGQPRVPYPMEPEDQAVMIAEWNRRMCQRHQEARKEVLGPDGAVVPPHAAIWHVRIPADSYFMLGDNSPQSSDARFWHGQRFARKESMIGKPAFIFWPLETPPWALRFVH